jgi:hypothetical protein
VTNSVHGQIAAETPAAAEGPGCEAGEASLAQVASETLAAAE